MNVYHKGAIPFVLLLIPYLFGIGAGFNSNLYAGLSYLYCGLAVTMAIFIGLNLLYKRAKIDKVKWIGGALLFILLIITGIINVIQSKQLNNADHFSKAKAQYLIAKITTEPAWKNETLRFTATVEQGIMKGKKQAVTGNLLVSIKDDKAKRLAYGDALLIPAKYYEVDPPLNPAEFNYKRYLANKNIYHRAYLYQRQYVLLQHKKGNPVIAYALKLRQGLVNKLKINIPNPDAAAVASTLILGYKAELSSDILQAYSKTGTIHVLSVSGAHVGLVYLVLAFVLSFFNAGHRGRVARAVIIIGLVWFYALLTGFSPPVCRAAVMLSLIITGKTYSRHISSLNILAFSAFIMLLIDPLLISDVGFQLSYLAVGGLIVLQPLIYRQLAFKNKWADKLWVICSASIAAQVITFPLSAYYFHQVPVYFLFSNLFILLPSAIILCGGIAYLFLPHSFILAKWLGYLLEQSILFTNKTLIIIENMPFASINKVWLTKPEYILLYVLIAVLFTRLYNRKRRLAYASMLLSLLFCIGIGLKRHNAATTHEMIKLNLRKYTGTIYRDGSNAVVVTDLPAESKAYSWSVQPYLDSCKVSEVKLIGLNDDITTAYLVKKGNVVKFMGSVINVTEKISPGRK